MKNQILLSEHNTYRRVLAYKVYEIEIERLVGEYSPSSKWGEICALDGKVLLGMSKREDATSKRARRVYDAQIGKTMSQVLIDKQGK